MPIRRIASPAGSTRREESVHRSHVANALVPHTSDTAPAEGHPESNRTEDGDYIVGRNRTPVGTRWKPGQSGNPKGRPRKKPPTIDVHEIVMELMAKELRVNTPAGYEVTDHLRVLMRKTFELAVKGNLGALRMLVGLVGEAKAKQATQVDVDEPLSEDEQNVLATLLSALAPDAGEGGLH